jgi:hypothetical protein
VSTGSVRSAVFVLKYILQKLKEHTFIQRYEELVTTIRSIPRNAANATTARRLRHEIETAHHAAEPTDWSDEQLELFRNFNGGLIGDGGANRLTHAFEIGSFDPEAAAGQIAGYRVELEELGRGAEYALRGLLGDSEPRAIPEGWCPVELRFHPATSARLALEANRWTSIINVAQRLAGHEPEAPEVVAVEQGSIVMTLLTEIEKVLPLLLAIYMAAGQLPLQRRKLKLEIRKLEREEETEAGKQLEARAKARLDADRKEAEVRLLAQASVLPEEDKDDLRKAVSETFDEVEDYVETDGTLEIPALGSPPTVADLADKLRVANAEHARVCAEVSKEEDQLAASIKAKQLPKDAASSPAATSPQTASEGGGANAGAPPPEPAEDVV